VAEKRRRLRVPEPLIVVAIVALVLVGVAVGGLLMQDRAERGALSGSAGPGLKERREVEKLTAEIRNIRSDTAGSLFWLKLAAVFVTVGAGVGGYVISNSRSSRAQVAAERRARVDAAFGSIVQELSSVDSPLLRATAAMKLGKVLQSPPIEWQLDDDRREELWSLSRQILAAALSIEDDPKVLKALTIAIALHPKGLTASLNDLDFSHARAADAYWKQVDFSGSDFYRANLRAASLRGAKLHGAQLYETSLVRAVLVGADCSQASFKFTDLRGADLSGAILTGAEFEGALVHGVRLDDATTAVTGGHEVDFSAEGDGSDLVAADEWPDRARAEQLARAADDE